jgi:ribosomal protein L37AE/L43A
MNDYQCVDCGKRATVFNSDGAYRCKPCQSAHNSFVRAVLTGRARREREALRKAGKAK